MLLGAFWFWEHSKAFLSHEIFHQLYNEEGTQVRFTRLDFWYKSVPIHSQVHFQNTPTALKVDSEQAWSFTVCAITRFSRHWGCSDPIPAHQDPLNLLKSMHLEGLPCNLVSAADRCNLLTSVFIPMPEIWNRLYAANLDIFGKWHWCATGASTKMGGLKAATKRT